MNTKELFDLIKARKRMCESKPSCFNCPLRFATCRLDSDLENIGDLDRLIRTIKEWDAAHPALEEVGKGIYYDPKHRIVPDEVTRVTTIEMTQVVPKEFIEAIGNHEITQDKIEEYKDGLRELFMLHFDPDDLHIKVQQFVTKCHEEEREDAEKWRE